MSWKKEFKEWQKRDLSQKRYAYFWADGIYLEARLEEKQCMLVIIGVDEIGKNGFKIPYFHEPSAMMIRFNNLIPTHHFDWILQIAPF